MKTESPPEDKVRYIYDDLPDFRPEGRPAFHTIEVSDERSYSNFVTLYVTWPLGEPTFMEFIKGVGKANNRNLLGHDAEMYHRGGEGNNKVWLINHFPEDKIPHLVKHYHWVLTEKPNVFSVKEALDKMGVGSELKSYVLRQMS